MEKLNLDKRALRKFGITLAIAFLIITLIIFIRHKYSPRPTFIISAIFFISAFTMPTLLRPLYVIWMKFAFILDWINTRLILFIIFYLIFTPAGIVMRLFGVDLLNRKIDKNKNSYWQKAVKRTLHQLNYEKQF
jgi:hypothetical protein